MYTNNPYAQGGWTNPANRNSVNNGAWTPANPPQPSIFGALPFPAAAPSQTLLTFNFTSFSPNILNCVVLGPQNKQYFRVINNTPSQGTTLFQRADGKNFAVIEWQQNATVEVRDVIQRQNASQWLALSPDRSQRVMEARGKWYTWAPRDNIICLYTVGAGSAPPELYARVTRAEGSVTLEIVAEAVQKGLLEVCIVAVVLMQSGRSID